MSLNWQLLTGCMRIYGAFKCSHSIVNWGPFFSSATAPALRTNNINNQPLWTMKSTQWTWRTSVLRLPSEKYGLIAQRSMKMHRTLNLKKSPCWSLNLTCQAYLGQYYSRRFHSSRRRSSARQLASPRYLV